MASSRWKRFAFFEKNNLTLPHFVIQDVIPSSSPVHDPYSTTSRPNVTPSVENVRKDNEANIFSCTKGDYVSLVITNGASFPPSSVSHILEETEPRLGVKGMQVSITTCHNTSNGSTPDEDIFIPFSSRENHISSSSNSSYNRNSNKDVLGPMPVLAFLSSKSTNFVHCIDLTVRCNPISSSYCQQENGKSDPTVVESQMDKNNKISKALEGMDGWRGCLNPFSHGLLDESISYSADSSSSSPYTAKAKARIVGMAICSSTDEEAYAISKNKRSGQNDVYLACITNVVNSVAIVVVRNPHLYLGELGNDSEVSTIPKAEVFQPPTKFDFAKRGHPTTVTISYSNKIVAIGTDKGVILVYSFNRVGNKGGLNSTSKLNFFMEIAAPYPESDIGEFVVSSLRLVLSYETEEPVSRKEKIGMINTAGLKTYLFATYCCKGILSSKNKDGETMSSSDKPPSHAETGKIARNVSGRGGIFCYDIGNASPHGTSYASSSPSPLARYDLDGRHVPSSCLCDIIETRKGNQRSTGAPDNFIVARSDGLYTYSPTDKASVSPIDGIKIATCCIPSPPGSQRRLNHSQFETDLSLTSEEELGNKNGSFVTVTESGSSYILVASTDSKSKRDTVDVYDTTNKLVAFHVLLSPGHKALRASGITTNHRTMSDGAQRGGLSSAIVLTSGGSIVTLTEKLTSKKVLLLVQKNLYSAAISMAFADPSYKAIDIMALYQRHAEHLYRKGDFMSAMDQYIHTIGSLQPSYVIFRFLDASKIPLLIRYLEELRSRNLSSIMHSELLKTCYLKLHKTDAAERLATELSSTLESSKCISALSSSLHNPSEALSIVCSFEAPYAVEALTQYGATLARTLPRETAGLVMRLCDGTYTPSILANNSETAMHAETKSSTIDRPVVSDKYPAHLFSNSFLENSKLLRMILAHCYQKKCILSSELKRTLLELTLEEWNAAKRVDDAELMKTRHKDAMSVLTDQHEDIGDCEALVIVQLAGFIEGEVLLYERMQIVPLLLEQYAKNGNEKSRRQMLAMCRSDPELLADVLGKFVTMSNKDVHFRGKDKGSINAVSESEMEQIFKDIKEGLTVAQAQGVLPPARVVRILAGEGSGEFSNVNSCSQQRDDVCSVPLPIALDYIGSTLDESKKTILQLKNSVEEYNNMCNAMEAEINDLLDSSGSRNQLNKDKNNEMKTINIEVMYKKASLEVSESYVERVSGASSEEFWREISQSEDRYDTVARFFAKHMIS